MQYDTISHQGVEAIEGQNGGLIINLSDTHRTIGTVERKISTVIAEGKHLKTICYSAFPMGEGRTLKTTCLDEAVGHLLKMANGPDGY